MTEKKTFRLDQSLEDLRNDPTVLKVSRGLAQSRAAGSRPDRAFGVETVDDAIRKLKEWQAKLARPLKK